ncbi:glycoside hydrolase family 140 protein [Paenibacillus senegalensis]|uniref:glycoside hydrolase family 140 protein n=1 Tax=Paenibacillus senegalensis TaxID=1465766 RepID=UPI000288689A|nr:glycoside hydrolase family 140 protein [Paenibacillus senegalensis]
MKAENRRLQRLRVSENRRFLIREDGTPFFWLGDTAWNLFHKLSREDAELYLKKRAEQRFNVIQAVVLAEPDGVRSGNYYGRRPLKRNEHGRFDPALPDTDEGYSYWDHVDHIIRKASSLGLYIALLPTWGDKFNQLSGRGPEIFTEDNAYSYGRWLGERYKNDSNLIWVLGGDRPLQNRRHFAIIQALADGLKKGGGAAHLMTFHPKGSTSSSYHLHEEDWLDFNMTQSGHGDGVRDNYRLIKEDYARLPVKPVLDSEPCYEDFPRGFQCERGYFDETDVRTAAYYAVFAGACGHTYGHQSVWAMSDGMYGSFEMTGPGTFFIMDWKAALDRPGANQMQHLRALMEALEDPLSRIPDQGLIADNFKGSNYRVATRGETYAMIYCPNGLFVHVVMGRIAGSKVRASWFKPANGMWSELGFFDNLGIVTFTAPSSGRGNDWVLFLKSE